MRIGFVGSGRLGQALAKRLVAAGHDIMISNSRGREAVLQTAQDIGCQAGSASDAARFGDIVVVSVPLSAFALLPVEAMGERIVVDTCNYYPTRDGVRPELENGGETTSSLLQKTLPKAVVVKAFNSVLASHLARGGVATPDGERHALPIASDDPAAGAIVGKLVEDAGFASVFSGPIVESWQFERARPGYCRALSAAMLRQVLAETQRSDFVTEGSWRS